MNIIEDAYIIITIGSMLDKIAVVASNVKCNWSSDITYIVSINQETVSEFDI